MKLLINDACRLSVTQSANIEAMFSQADVSPTDRAYLLCLWWMDKNLESQSMVYENKSTGILDSSALFPTQKFRHVLWEPGCRKNEYLACYVVN